MSLLGTIASALGIGKEIKDFIDKLSLSAEEKAKLEAEITKTLLQAQARIISSEARSESWLTRSWRPITMLTFLAILVANAFGLTPPLDPQFQMKLLDIIHFGLGGYVVGRSAEKIVPTLLTAISQFKSKGGL